MEVTKGMQFKAYGLLDIKAYDDDTREISGTASTIETDRYGDIVEPSGAKFATEIPLLWQHSHSDPVGWANLTAKKSTIDFTAKLAKIDEDGDLKKSLDKAWQMVKIGLVKGVSIGFRALEWAWMEESNGIRFTEIEIYELSIVTIPANAGASISTIKAYANNTIPLQKASITTKSVGADSGIRLIKAGVPLNK